MARVNAGTVGNIRAEGPEGENPAMGLSALRAWRVNDDNYAVACTVDCESELAQVRREMETLLEVETRSALRSGDRDRYGRLLAREQLLLIEARQS